MRAGLSTIQQTLTPEAASVLNHSIAEAGRRNHGQTTPLHVAATLLSSPSGFLRQACIRSHPNSSHPLQCRALELCFSVALERLPTAQTMAAAPEPPISNALMAALKRAQAHQRRGCPEQQQQPLLAVKVELEQLIISILDDPSVSRVMREASFSSPAIKATIEQSMSSPATSSAVKPPTFGIGGFRPSPMPIPMPNRNLYLNPLLQQQNNSAPRNDEVKRVIDILLRSKKRNPVLVGDSEPETVMNELLRRIEKGEMGEGPLNDVQVIQLDKEFVADKSQILGRLKELESRIETQLGNNSVNGGGIVLDLGDLKWLVEQPLSFGVPGSGGLAQQVVSETARATVVEMGKMLAKFGDDDGNGNGNGNGNGRLWFVGTATCETYLRCQVYHSSMENDWDLQAVPIASRSPLQGMFARKGTNGIISSSVESLTPLKSFPHGPTAQQRLVSDNSGSTRGMSCCPRCTQNYEQELAKLVNEDFKKSSSEVKSAASAAADPSPLPQWLKNAKVHADDTQTEDHSKTKDEEMIIKQKTQELQKKWGDTCSNLHPDFHRYLGSQRITPTPLSMTGLYNPKLLERQSFPSKLQQSKNSAETLQLNTDPQLQRARSPTGSPVRMNTGLYNPKLLERQSFQSKLQQSKNIGENLQSNRNPNPLANQPLQCTQSPTASPVRMSPGLYNPKLSKLQQSKSIGESLQLNPSPGSPVRTGLGLYNPKLLERQSLQPKAQQSKSIGETLQLNPNPVASTPLQRAGSPPGSPVRTELVLGITETTTPEENHKERVKDFLGCISSEPQAKFNEWQSEKFANPLDADTFKKLLKGLMEKVWWQREASSAVATAITTCKLGNGKQRGAGSKGDIWVLFTGPDRIGKKKMASVIAEQVCGANPITIGLGSRRNDEELDLTFRGKTAIDRIAEAVRRNPSSVIMLEDFDEADMLVRRSIKRAMERGRLADSHGREISLGNIIFILTAHWMPDNLKNAPIDHLLDENKLSSIASGGWQLRLSLGEKSGKRRANWLHGEDRAAKCRRELGSGVSFDLNELADIEENRTDGSYNSSDLTFDHEDELGLENGRFPIAAVPHELMDSLDDAIVFKPVVLGHIRRKIEKTIAEKFSRVMDDNLSIEVQDEALEKILGGIWLGRTSLEDWVEKVLGSSFHQLKARLPALALRSADERMVVRLEPEPESNGQSERRSRGDWLPNEISVVVVDAV